MEVKGSDESGGENEPKGMYEIFKFFENKSFLVF